MDNKYGLGSSKVANQHHETHHSKAALHHPLTCKFCQHTHLVLSLTMHDHRCASCGQWQNDVPVGYSTGRMTDY